MYVARSVIWHFSHLHGKKILFATFSMPRFRITLGLPSLHVAQPGHFSLQSEHTKCPREHCRIGGNTYPKQMWHSKQLSKFAIDVTVASADGWTYTMQVPKFAVDFIASLSKHSDEPEESLERRHIRKRNLRRNPIFVKMILEQILIPDAPSFNNTLTVL